ncbi:MAG: hypothetical protein QOK47_866 [Actinomycetota bacterium]|nr:hypothetical protein [Actinomycetota bacterium]
MHRRTLIVAAAVVIFVGLVALLLSTGDDIEATAKKTDPAGDVKVDKGPLAPRDVDTADIQKVDARIEGGVLTLLAQMGKQLARPVPDQTATWRWEIYEDEAMTWIVSANLDLGPSVSVIATQGDFEASTNDKSFPGKVSIAGDTILIRLRTSEVDGFPPAFETFLETSLDGMRTQPGSALARDRAPDEGYLQVGG